MLLGHIVITSYTCMKVDSPNIENFVHFCTNVILTEFETFVSVSLQSFSAIGVETKDTWPGTVTKLRMVCIAVLFHPLQF